MRLEGSASDGPVAPHLLLFGSHLYAFSRSLRRGHPAADLSTRRRPSASAFEFIRLQEKRHDEPRHASWSSAEAAGMGPNLLALLPRFIHYRGDAPGFSRRCFSGPRKRGGRQLRQEGGL